MWPSLVDDLYFVLHDSVTGHARLHPRLTSLALAGAALAELTLTEQVTVDLTTPHDRLYATTQYATGDPLSRSLLGHIIAEPHHPVGTWLLFFARTIYADVRSRMVAGKLLNPPARHLLKQQPAAPVDPNRAAWPLSRLNLTVQRGEPPAIGDRVLYGLLAATGCAQRVMWEHDPAFMTAMTAALPVPLRRLLAQTKIAVGQAVISRR
ncbi:hypothetical protein Sme01_48110 [Sphaerisporangium melleum]|uniref:GPP34 family phosphoprotein n=1 Tax=Sphaerisporangium melleum TaxID=321316 RepID=A0A917VIC8_9ACTN|nr:hypothetical protein GCM10007964_31780 [Sphaerisporangium melleum]GII72335.1 hypothetical protein Sme01_48110 [Sphaerisporangium melleum]